VREEFEALSDHCRLSFSECPERADVNSPAMVLHSRVPMLLRFVPVDTLNARRIVGLEARPVFAILLVVYKPEVFRVDAGCVVADMVN